MVPLPDPKDQETGVQGAIVFILDAIQIVKKATFGVVSGSTGYAWVINPQGILFDHIEDEFVGRSLFEVRKARNVQLSYKIIDDLTLRELLQRKEGTAQYVSGWHRQKLTKTTKLIAYTPIPFYETPERKGSAQPLLAEEFWSVALVAPIEEVSGLIRSLNIRQFILFGIFQLLIIVRHRDVGLSFQSLVQYPGHRSQPKDRGTQKVPRKISPLRTPGGRRRHGQSCVP